MRASRQALLDASLAVIENLQQEDGGITATPVDDAYPYVYPRDAVFMTMALNAFGQQERSKRFYRYLLTLRRQRGEFYQRYNRGFPYVTNEHELDVTPIVIQGIYDVYNSDGGSEEGRTFLESMWGLTKECAEFTISSVSPDVGLIYSANSIHESRELEEGYELWTNSAAVRGLYDASIIAGLLGYSEQEQTWLTSASRLGDSVATKLYDHDKGNFIKVMRRSGEKVTAPDMSQLAPFYFRILEDNAVLSKTLEHLKRNLWNEKIGGFNRFRDFEVVNDWHWYTGGTSAVWPFFTIWAARFYRELGVREEEDACLSFIDSVTTSDHFLPEKVAPLEEYGRWKATELEFGDRLINGVMKIENHVHTIETPGYVCWACPLGWAHAEYIFLEKRSKEMEKRREVPLLLSEVPAVARHRATGTSSSEP